MGRQTPMTKTTRLEKIALLLAFATFVYLVITM